MSTSRFCLRRSLKRGFTFLELCICILILSILVAITVASGILTTKREATVARSEGNLKVLNETAIRLRIVGDGDNPGVNGSDKQAALDYYMQHGFLIGRTVSLEGIDFVDGKWQAVPPGP